MPHRPDRHEDRHARTPVPLHRRLCSRSNAVRVAARLTAAGEHVAVVATPEPLQPWRVVEVAEAASPSLRRLERCA